MATSAMDTLSDAELQELAARAQDMLQQREAGRRLDAVEQARGILAGVGLTFREAETIGGAAKGKGKQRSAKPVGSRTGQRYVNPANASQAWEAGRGRKPKWLTELEAAGTAPAPVSG